MYTVTYYKFGDRWYLDAPEYLEQGGSPEDLERIGAFHDLLELAAEGESTVVFQMDTEPFEDADLAELTGSSGGKSGGYYRLHSFGGQPVDIELWFNTMVYINFPELPPRIYFRKVAFPHTL